MPADCACYICRCHPALRACLFSKPKSVRGLKRHARASVKRATKVARPTPPLTQEIPLIIEESPNA